MGVDIHAKDDMALYWASENNSLNIIKIILKNFNHGEKLDLEQITLVKEIIKEEQYWIIEFIQEELINNIQEN